MAIAPEKPKTLAEFFGVDQADFKLTDPSTFAHVIIDVQREFCDPDYRISVRNPRSLGTQHTLTISQRIAFRMPDFRTQNIHTVIVYYNIDNDLYQRACGGPCLIQKEESDIILPKTKDSAFEETHIHRHLQELGIKNLLVSGFNARACVRDSVIDAIQEGYKVAVMKDCIGDNMGLGRETPEHLGNMERHGAFITMSKDAIEFLKSTSPAPTLVA